MTLTRVTQATKRAKSCRARRALDSAIRDVLSGGIRERQKARSGGSKVPMMHAAVVGT